MMVQHVRRRRVQPQRNRRLDEPLAGSTVDELAARVAPAQPTRTQRPVDAPAAKRPRRHVLVEQPLLLKLQRRLRLGQVPRQGLAPFHLLGELPLQALVLVADALFLLSKMLGFLLALLFGRGQVTAQLVHLRAEVLDVGRQLGGGVVAVLDPVVDFSAKGKDLN